MTFTPADTASYTPSTAIGRDHGRQGDAGDHVARAGRDRVRHGADATQLNATASVRGTFVYTPAAGAVLAPGAQTLSVTFTPDDTANYTTATATCR